MYVCVLHVVSECVLCVCCVYECMHTTLCVRQFSSECFHVCCLPHTQVMESSLSISNGAGPTAIATSARPQLSTYHRSQVPPPYREPFIVHGYRKSNASISECVRYALVWHNDVCNFWSHFLPVIVWVIWLYLLSLSHDLSRPFYYPLLCFWLGACSYAVFSSTAHLFGCRSILVRTFCFMLDYLGISIYVAGGGIYSLHHQLPLSSSLYHYLFPLICVHLVASAAATLFSSLSRFFWLKQRFVIRAMAYSPAYSICIAPFYLRLLSCATSGQDCLWGTLHLHLLSVFLTWALLFFFVTKIPERFSQGRFDIFPQSHTLFHILSAALTSVQMYVFPRDSEERKIELIERVSPSFEWVVLPFLGMIGVGLCVILFLTWLVVRGVLIPNRCDTTTQSLSGDKKHE